MAVLLFKLFTLIVRTMARPLISWVTYYNRVRLQSSKGRVSNWIKVNLVILGQKVNYYNTTINRKLFKLPSKEAIRPLTEDKALERGAEFISEFIVYSILLLLPIYELVKLGKASNEKEYSKEMRMCEMRNDLNHLVVENEEIINELREIKENVLILREQIKSRKNIKNSTDNDKIEKIKKGIEILSQVNHVNKL